MTKFVFTLAMMVTVPAQVCAQEQCAADGEPIQWIVDYCMMKMETDDEIAVSDCIEEEARKPFASSCASNRHFKKGMCEVMISIGARSDTVDQCVEDTTFKGRTVEAGGVGA